MKNSKKTLGIVLAVSLMTASFAACSKEAESKPSREATETTEEVIETFNIDERDEFVTVTLMSDEELEDYHNYFRCVLSDDEFATNVVFQFADSITDFKFVTFDATINDNGEISFENEHRSYSIAELDSEMSMIFATDLPEIVPISGIRYTTNDGEDHFSVLLVSGEDGSAFVNKVV